MEKVALGNSRLVLPSESVILANRKHSSYSSRKNSKLYSSQSGLDYMIIFKLITMSMGLEYCNWQDLVHLPNPGNWNGNQKHMDCKLKSTFPNRW